MAHSIQFLVTNMPVDLSPPELDGYEITIKTRGIIYLGGIDVTTKTGYQLFGGETIKMTLAPGEHIYGVTEKNQAIVYVLAAGEINGSR